MCKYYCKSKDKKYKEDKHKEYKCKKNKEYKSTCKNKKDHGYSY
jgi:hypothetical protein